MSETIYARFDDYKLAEKAVGAMLDHGLDKEDVTLMMPGGSIQSGAEHDAHAKQGITTTTGADATSGAAKGAGVGAILGALGALAALTIPGFGVVIGGGALATALSTAVGTAVAGAVAGGMTGFLQDQGIDEPVARKYEDALKNGGAVLALNLPSDKLTRADADAILTKYGVAEVNAGRRFIATAL